MVTQLSGTPEFYSLVLFKTIVSSSARIILNVGFDEDCYTSFPYDRPHEGRFHFEWLTMRNAAFCLNMSIVSAIVLLYLIIFCLYKMEFLLWNLTRKVAATEDLSCA